MDFERRAKDGKKVFGKIFWEALGNGTSCSIIFEEGRM